MIDFKAIEKKWQKRLEEKKVFEANPDNKKKIFTSLIIPYVNADLHIGHAFTYTRIDAYARFKRMRGHNVMLAQGFHATGEPILGAVERLRKNDEKQLKTFEMMGIEKDEIENFKNKGPEYVAKFWMKKIIETSKSIGYSVDWRRTFITAVDPCFSRFIEWQYNLLKERGYVKQGTHPVVWCPHCESPTGDHDRLEGEGESPIEYVMIKFEFVDELSGKTFFIPCATLRPETIYGVTNIWVNPNTEYVIAIVEKGYTGADVGGEVWIISKECAEKIRAQLYDVQEIGRVHASQLVGKRVVEPMNKKEIPILPADFVDPQNATGIVMSVPSHAPYDWIAIKELTDSGLEKYGVNKDDMEPISLIETEGFGKHPAIEVCKTLGITSQKQTAKLDEATSMIYKKEFHQGILKNNCGEYAGKKVSEVKLHLTNDFIRKKNAALLWEITGRVVCRCTTLCHVKILEDQWFLTYSDKEWKTRVLEHLAEMKICPEEARSQFENTIDWLKDKACARKTGLGTKLPWDKEWIVETLSDSTIYMAYYTVAHIINEHNITAEQLTKEVFDFVFRGVGSVKEVVKKSGISEKILNQMKKEFEYFYPVDMRSSGKDLVQHHLLFYLFHHIAIFEKN
ncbi:MAG: leucine--tRNA ligase, partial [Thaumarchaeota archaeon]|nr:leucine--tRNA ligase [Nitrososphaerota archaeon]